MTSWHGSEMAQPSIPAGRLVLRPFRADDIDWVHRVSLEPAVQHFLGLPSPYRREHAEFFVLQMCVAGWETRERAEFVIEDAGTGERLGRAGLALTPIGVGQIGYWMAAEARGRGVATDAAKVLCRWAFDELRLEVVEWRAEVGNHPSRRVAEKAGFQVEGTLRRRLLHRGALVDAWVGSLLNEEAPRSS
ncbi:GNAT family N-acetyltransferase [Actinoplanes sp. GCM10030250]|uniref:GNAT family N-acetyltransferase n=1 Tax=Actinoplanes sp. GCM10030250 TaxID=3273376 RepID=UPI003619B208